MKYLFGFISLLFSAELAAQCAVCQYPVDLVTNGAFTQGNTGFTSDLDYVTGIFTCPLCPENTYTVGANAFLYHSGFFGFDHTNPPNGNFFIANGQGQSGSAVWCQSFVVQPNTTYTFTFWAMDVNSNNDPHPFAQLQAQFNGVLAADTLLADGAWEEYTTTWFSGSSLTLDLCIINQQSQTGGNDFGLDDISFTTCYNYVMPQPAFAGNDASICSNVDLQLGTTPNNGYNYSWNINTGLSAEDIANPEFSLENTSGSDVQLEFVLTTDSANVGCVQSDTVLITVLSVPLLFIGNDTIVCPFDEISVDIGNEWNTIAWSNMETTSTTILYQGTWWVDVTYNTCAVSDTILITAQWMPIGMLGNDIDACVDTPPTIDAGYVGLWSTGVTSQTITVDETGSYTFTYTDGACSETEEIFVTIVPLPIVNLPFDTTFCEGTSLTLDAGISGEWSTGVTASSITITTPDYYGIIVTDGPCTVIDGTEVYMQLLPVASLPEDLLVCENTVVLLDAFAEQNDTYLWSNDSTASSINVNESGVYEVMVMNECGTTESETFVDTYPCDWQIFIPSAFTPNEDGYNEGWQIAAYNVTNVEIHIYNRLGNLIYYTNDVAKAWTPSIAVGDDVYNYRITALTFDDDWIEQRGHIYLLR
ncbi:MAG: gliding motility-associated C-terminal domain-containing protein [Flavobacteriales bacterium]